MGCRGFVVQSAWKVLTAVAVFGYKWKSKSVWLSFTARERMKTGGMKLMVSDLATAVNPLNQECSS